MEEEGKGGESVCLLERGGCRCTWDISRAFLGNSFHCSILYYCIEYGMVRVVCYSFSRLVLVTGMSLI